METLVGQYYLVGQSVGEQYYSASRIAAGVETPYTPVLGPDIIPEALSRSLGATGPARFKELVGNGTPPQEAFSQAIESQAGVAERYLHNGSRGTVIANVLNDKKAIGWQRLSANPTGHPCAFCALLISRGPVYKRKAQADFKAHDKCYCFAEPFYTNKAQSVPIATEYRDVYDEATQNTSGQDSINAFRRAYQHKYRPDLYKPQEA